MAADGLPTRLIICVDGTWCTPDGPHGNPLHNISNIYRIFACIKSGVVEDQISGRRFNQESEYYEGIGSGEDITLLSRVQQGISGGDCIKQIRNIYERCCKIGTHPHNEIWFYGYSRGAYVVRAVAGLLHYLTALISAGTPAFKEDYRQALKVYEIMQKNGRLPQGQIHSFFAAKTRPAPRIQFLGAFDTVKSVRDHSLYDISFNESIQHMRHALALNEDREEFLPEYIFPEFNSSQLRKRTFIQAWFVGAHRDMGGSAPKDGLSLYPLQWILIESYSLGLVLEFHGSFGRRAKMDNPLEVVHLQDIGRDLIQQMWSCTVSNGITIKMQDIRDTHENPNHNGRYGVYLNNHHVLHWARQPRQSFVPGSELLGHCSYASQGTILHPSVYLIFDEFCHVLLDSKKLGIRTDIDRWRSQILPDIQGGPHIEFWNERQLMSIDKPGVVRVLVCGNCGVGKSSLVNKIFGVEVTHSSERETGKHDVNEEFTTVDCPNIVIHDSGGFEAGGTDELDAVENFMKKTSEATEIKNRLHVIWFCIELNSSRTKQKGAKELFKVISQHAKNVPIVIIGTKKDEFMDMKIGVARRQARKSNGDDSDAACKSYAEACFLQRMRDIKNEILSLEGGRFNVAIGVSTDPDDKETIEQLTEETAQCFDQDSLRLLYVAAQVTRIDMKIDLAIEATIRIYRHSVRTALGTSAIPGGPTTTRVAVATTICSAIITCFGIPKLSPKTVLSIIDAVIWSDMGHNFSVFFAEGLSITCMMLTLFSGGILAPVMVIPGIVNGPVVVPATARLFLMLASDVILILVRAFKVSANKCVGQPLKMEIEAAAAVYKGFSKQVHAEVKEIITCNVVRSFQTARVREGFEKLIGKYKDEVADLILKPGIEVVFPNGKMVDDSDSDDDDDDDEVTIIGDEEKL